MKINWAGHDATDQLSSRAHGSGTTCYQSTAITNGCGRTPTDWILTFQFHLKKHRSDWNQFHFGINQTY